VSSLTTKLGLRPGQTVRVLEGRGEALDVLTAALPDGVEILHGEEDTPRCDQIFFWPRSLDGLAERFAGLQRWLVPDGSLWVVMPKKAFAARHGIAFSWEEMQAAALTTDLVDNKNASMTGEEYATRFVIRRARRHLYA
jgi:hypothetical protein